MSFTIGNLYPVPVRAWKLDGGSYLTVPSSTPYRLTDVQEQQGCDVEQLIAYRGRLSDDLTLAASMVTEEVRRLLEKKDLEVERKVNSLAESRAQAIDFRRRHDRAESAVNRKEIKRRYRPDADGYPDFATIAKHTLEELPRKRMTAGTLARELALAYEAGQQHGDER
jgi:hypothetical protein